MTRHALTKCKHRSSQATNLHQQTGFENNEPRDQSYHDDHEDSNQEDNAWQINLLGGEDEITETLATTGIDNQDLEDDGTADVVVRIYSRFRLTS